MKRSPLLPALGSRWLPNAAHLLIRESACTVMLKAASSDNIKAITHQLTTVQACFYIWNMLCVACFQLSLSYRNISCLVRREHLSLSHHESIHRYSVNFTSWLRAIFMARWPGCSGASEYGAREGNWWEFIENNHSVEILQRLWKTDLIRV